MERPCRTLSRLTVRISGPCSKTLCQRGRVIGTVLLPADLAKSAAALADSRLFDQSHSQPEPEVLRSTIRAASVAVEAWIPFDAEMAERMVRVAHLVGNPEEVFPALLSGASKADEGIIAPTVWMSSAFTLVEGLVQLGSGEDLEHGIEVPLSVEHWVEVSHEVMEKDSSGLLLQYFVLPAVQPIDEQLARQIANPSTRREHLHSSLYGDGDQIQERHELRDRPSVLHAPIRWARSLATRLCTWSRRFAFLARQP